LKDRQVSERATLLRIVASDHCFRVNGELVGSETAEGGTTAGSNFWEAGARDAILFLFINGQCRCPALNELVLKVYGQTPRRWRQH